VVGHQAIASAAPDGYTIGMITVEITMMHHQKLTDLNPSSYTPIALMNLDPAGFQVRADSPYKSMGDVIAAVRANPGKLKASGTGQGGIWHLALAGMLSDMKIDPASVPWVPSNGAAPGLQDLVAGGIEFVPCSLPEARSLIDAGKVRSLAVMDGKRASLFPAVPTLKEATGSGWTTGAWRGIAAPKGLPADVRTRLEASLKKVWDSKEFQDFMSQRGFGTIWGNGEDFAKFMARGDTDMKAVMTAVGIVK
jgi:tripartite-type tricarboxylate transporter receptor subunit TctC